MATGFMTILGFFGAWTMSWPRTLTPGSAGGMASSLGIGKRRQELDLQEDHIHAAVKQAPARRVMEILGEAC